MDNEFQLLDEALERVARLQERLLADVDTPQRSERLALVFASEARLWSQLFELCSERLTWRAALAAEARARSAAHVWGRRAVTESALPRAVSPAVTVARSRAAVAMGV